MGHHVSGGRRAGVVALLAVLVFQAGALNGSATTNPITQPEAPSAAAPIDSTDVPRAPSEAAFSDTFKRLYFTTSRYSVHPTVPFSPEWNNVDNTGRYRLSDTPLNTVDGSHNPPHGATVHNKAHRQFLYRLSGSGTVEGWVRAFMRTRTRTGIGINEAAQDMISQVTIRVVNSTGTVVRGTALHAYNASSSAGQSKWDAWTFRNRKFPAPGRWEQPLFGARMNPVSYSDGDYLVVEIGLRNFNTTHVTGGHTWYNDKAASDVLENQTDTTNLRSWIEFSPPSPTLEQMLGNCAAGHGTCPYNLESDPVNTATGNYVSSVTDLSLPGRGLPFAFTRTYNSLDPNAGALGRGWRHPYEARLIPASDGGVTFVAEDGARIVYWPTSGGAYTTPNGLFSMLVKNGDGTYELTRRDQVRYGFDSTGLLTALLDRNGNQLTFTYTSGKLTTITDTVGRTVTLAYNANGRLETLSGPPARTVTYSYDGSGRLSTVTDARGKVWTYAYDTQHRLETVTDPNSHVVVTNEYGADGRISAQTDARGKRGTFAWDPATEISTYTDARGKAWIDDYERGRLVRQRDPLGNETLHTYDADFNVTSVTDPRGHATTMTSDAAGNLLTRTSPSPLNHVETWTYTARNDVDTYTDGRNNTTTFAYDTAGNLSRISAPEGADTDFGRDPAGTGLLVSLTDPRDKVTTSGYDAQANLTSITSPLGNLTGMGYDAAGRLTSVVDPRGNVSGATPADYTTTFTYDGADHLLTATDPLGNVTESRFDAAGNFASVIDPDTHATSYGYDAANNLTSVTDALNGVTTYAYDDVGNVTSRTDANNHVTTYTYDDANRLTSDTDPLTNIWSLTYDAAGNVATRTDAKDHVITYTHDALNRLTGIDYAASATPDVTLMYDANHNLTTMTDGGGTETYAYDDLDLLETVTRGTNVFSYAYDLASNLTSRTYPDATATTYTFDDDGRMTTAVDGSASTTYGYDPAGNLKTIATPDGYVARYAYDRAGRLLEVAHRTDTDLLSRFTYQLDAAGNRTAMTTRLGTVSYRYDDLNRLTGACWAANCPWGAGATPAPCLDCGAATGVSRPADSTPPDPADTFVTYTYDSVGNRQTEATHLGTTTYVYDAGDRITSRTPPGQSAISYTYDDNGNQLSAGSDTFSWDAADRLASATAGGVTESYAYAGDGRRLSVTSGGSTTSWWWDVAHPLPMLALERDGSGAVTRRSTYGLGRITTTVGTALAYQHADGLGSVADLTDPTGNPVAWIEYQPFGAVRTSGAAGALAVPFGFTGEFSDQTGLAHLRARQYDPATGRFLSQDPLSPPLAHPHLASYAYARNAPINAIDPAGLWYLDINVSLGFIGGVTFGVQINEDGLRPYAGVGLMTSPSLSVQISPLEPSTGWNVGAQGTYGVSGQAGYSFNDQSVFFEYGFGWPPGASVTAYYIWDPIIGPFESRPGQVTRGMRSLNKPVTSAATGVADSPK